MRKRSIHIPKGMTKDLSASKFSSEYYYDALNIKLTPADSNTLMSITNIKSNKKMQLYFLDKDNDDIGSSGTWSYLGHVVLNSYIVVFAKRTTTNPDSDTDYIYRIDTTANENIATQLLAYGNFNFSADYPIEGIGIYEKESVQKVYWVDGINQPRVINIVSDETPYPVIDYPTKLDFVRKLQLDEEITIQRNETTLGSITAGTIQYVFTYYNLYGQESNIFYQSPLYYISYNNRGASPEDTGVSASFTITVKYPDTHFEFLRIYSIHRGSTDAVPECRRVIDIPIDGNTITYVDEGVTGDAIDPSLLLYLGGREIIPYTMEHKDNTLFFGNYREKGSVISDTLKSTIGTSISFEAAKLVEINSRNPTSSYYSYKHQLANNSSKITTYKYGETYRFGVQLQKPTGEWSDPIFICDKENDVPPETSIYAQTAKLVQAKKTISSTWVDNAIAAKYVRVRPMVVFPSMADRTVICQGVLNPTVFNVGDRVTNSPFAQASWFFRPNYKEFSSDLAVTYPMVTNCVLMSVYLVNGTIPAQGTIIYLVKDDGTQITTVDTYSYYGMFTMTGPDRNAPVIVMRLTDVPASTDRSQVAYENYYLTTTQGSLSGQVAQVTIPVQNNNTPTWMWIDRWFMNLPEALKVVNAGDPLTWDSGYGWSSGTYTISRTLDSEDVFGSLSPLYTASWTTGTSSDATVSGTLTQFVHYKHLPYSDKRNAEIQCNYDTTDITVEASGSGRQAYIDKYSDMFFVDQSIVTLNSPDIDFDPVLQGIDSSSLKLRIVGCIPITSTIGDLDITTSTPQLNYYGTENITRGFWHELVGQASQPGCFGLNMVPAWFDEIYGYTYPNSSKKNSNSMVYGYCVYPWHRSGSMNNQPSAMIDDTDSSDTPILIKGQAVGYRSAVLKRKVMSNLRFSANTIYTSSENNFWDAGEVSIGLFNSQQVTNTRLNGQDSFGNKDINYYGNVDKVITSARKYPSDSPTITGYPIYGTEGFSAAANLYYHTKMASGVIQLIDSNPTGLDTNYKYGYDPISMRYKSNPHAVICMRGTGSTLNILPRFTGADSTAIPTLDTPITPFWGETLQVSQDTLPAQSDDYGYLWLGELYNDNHPEGTRFGGQSDDAIESNVWLPAGEAVDLVEGSPVTVLWTEGDTYFQRYDCLKTYPFSHEDANSIIDICSFMVETRVNIDGRYDRNRGQISNLAMTPENFNLLNPGYTQKNNFFNYKILDHNLFNNDYYPNYITWSKKKTPGEKIDTWTNVTLANAMDLDGDKGSIQSLKRFNNDLYCFQDRGISQILYNERTQLTTTDGVPVELANSDKVDGKRYLTETVGCQNKWSIATSPYGLYFIDANNKTINRLSQGIEDLTNIYGFNSWAENNIELGIWNPLRSKQGVYRAFYDGNDKEVFFVGHHSDHDCLVYSESLGQFSSFYSWGKALDIFNVDDHLFAFEDATLLGLYKQYEGTNYCRFFSTAYPFHVTYIDAQDPLDDKIYTNFEFRSTVENEGTYDSQTDKFTPTLPFDSLDVWNEYQHGIANLQNRNGHSAMLHHQLSNSASLKRKFRIWRCDVPRDNAPLETDAGLEITRFHRNSLDRIRNPWAYFKLTKNSLGSNKKIQLHDVIIDYFL